MKHELYDSKNILNDIAILELNEAAALSEAIQIACLPDPKWSATAYPYSNRSAAIIGWGTTRQSGKSSSNTLKNAIVDILDSSYCNRVAVFDTKNWDSQICAGKLDGSADTCQGKPAYQKNLKK